MIIRDVAKACLARNGIFSLSNIVADLNPSPATGRGAGGEGSGGEGIPRLKVRRALEKLEREGHIKRVMEKEKQLPGFSKGRPNKEPRYTALSSLKDRLAAIEDKRYQDTAWDRIWRAIRQLRRFTRRDLMVTASAGPENVKYFVARLVKAGYLRRIDRVTLALAKDPGPRRPSIKPSPPAGEGRPKARVGANGQGEGDKP